MIRFVFRMFSLLALVIAVVAATMDSIESVSSSDVALTSLASIWAQFNDGNFLAFKEAASVGLPLWLWDAIRMWVLPQPAFIAFLIVSLLCWMIGYKKPNPAGRFAA
ncbi:hypothetical protein ACQQ2Q_06995 [Agrobacterium sp. ES01]|uniref:hypothetical protein n=1 Tax=Agrobacterium sp. ES01 TaxID=3420714 RepID=UPI003D10E216